MAWFVAIAAIGSARAARADEPLQLHWRAPTGCPQEQAVREQIQRLVPAALRQKSPLRADGVITRVGGRFRLKLVLRWGEVSGERSIDADSC